MFSGNKIAQIIEADVKKNSIKQISNFPTWSFLSYMHYETLAFFGVIATSCCWTIGLAIFG